MLFYGKKSSFTTSRTAKRFEPYSKSPKNSSTEWRGDDRGGLSRSNHARAMELPKKQRANTAELKSEIVASSKSQNAQKPHVADPEFDFTDDKKQYYLNKDVLEKITKHWQWMTVRTIVKKLTEGKDLPAEGTSTSYLLKSMVGIWSPVTLLICLLATQMTKRRYRRPLRKANS